MLLEKGSYRKENGRIIFYPLTHLTKTEIYETKMGLLLDFPAQGTDLSTLQIWLKIDLYRRLIMIFK